MVKKGINKKKGNINPTEKKEKGEPHIAYKFCLFATLGGVGQIGLVSFFDREGGFVSVSIRIACSLPAVRLFVPCRFVRPSSHLIYWQVISLLFYVLFPGQDYSDNRDPG